MNPVTQMLNREKERQSEMALTKADVWGEYCDRTHTKLSDGMVVADCRSDICPVFGDKPPYKSVTVICQPDQCNEVEYWLEWVHGGGCISKIAQLEDGCIAIRSDYKCW
jgi:hypothetical protein